MTAGWVAIVALWFLLGYALYATVYAVAGALVSRQEDLQSSTGALNMVVIAALPACRSSRSRIPTAR